jgi:hypothetical protein
LQLPISPRDTAASCCFCIVGALTLPGQYCSQFVPSESTLLSINGDDLPVEIGQPETLIISNPRESQVLPERWFGGNRRRILSSVPTNAQSGHLPRSHQGRARFVYRDIPCGKAPNRLAGQRSGHPATR